MFAAVLSLHWAIQRFFGWKVADEPDAVSESRNNSADDGGPHDQPLLQAVHEDQIQAVSARNTQSVYAHASTAAPVGLIGEEAFPFLSDRDTVNFLRQSHIIFIMRGLPGSGKSTLVRRLRQTYPEAEICSADHFFTDSEGNYNFDAGKLSQAHEQCQERATDSCDRGQRVVIIDNTNIQAWTMTHYLNLAQWKYFYHCIIVEPNTPWRYDVEELAQRNTHNVEKAYIANKVKLIRDKKFLPTFYGWFLSRDDSASLVGLCHDTWQKCRDGVHSGPNIDGETCMAPKDFLYLLDQMYTTPYKMLHCTARFLGSNAKDSYHQHKHVLNAMGRKFSLKITGFAFSERNVSALVDLDTDDRENSSSKVLKNLFVKPEEEALRVKHKDDVSRKDSATFFKHGCSAHMTIFFRRGGQAKHSGDDILEMCEKEYLGKFRSLKKDFGVLKAYSGNMYQVILNEPVTMDCLFHGYYSMRGHR